MNFGQFQWRVARAATRVGFTSTHQLCMLLAMSHLEAKALERDAPTRLALHYHNFLGIKWQSVGLSKSYPHILLKPNQFEPSTALIPYRIYESLEHCATTLTWCLAHGDAYVPLTKKLFRDLASAAHKFDVYIDYLAEVYAVWSPDNPDGPKNVCSLFGRYVSALSLGLPHQQPITPELRPT